jgi:hypothetical protein
VRHFAIAILALMFQGCVSPRITEFPSLRLTVIETARVDVQSACPKAKRAVACCVNCQPGANGNRVVLLAWGYAGRLRKELCHVEYWDPEHKGPCSDHGNGRD